MSEEGGEESAAGNMTTSKAMTDSTDRDTIEIRMVTGKVARTSVREEVVAETAARMAKKIDPNESRIRALRKNPKSRNQFSSTRKRHSSSETTETK